MDGRREEYEDIRPNKALGMGEWRSWKRMKLIPEIRRSGRS
jgi:hypothetical protein